VSEVSATSRRGSLTRTVKAVLWSFVGLRKKSEYEQDVQQLNPIHVVIVGLVAALLFVIGLVFLARLAVSMAS
jgi:diacylglycerol kinase